MMACIPGFIPGLAAAHGRFGTQAVAALCQTAIRWAEEGHPVSSFEFAQLSFDAPYTTYFPSSRELFTPNGFLPQVGERFRNPKLAATLRKLAVGWSGLFHQGRLGPAFRRRSESAGLENQARRHVRRFLHAGWNRSAIASAIPKWSN